MPSKKLAPITALKNLVLIMELLPAMSLQLDKERKACSAVPGKALDKPAKA